ncbi:hypothetical protein [Yersinia massiliensis]|uniref:hypothetical protein n=1 Tax=Yersinia massiliensis TaxID=419257 RepID=UPI0011A99609|nr:hypothetical protein [Yersinia massiliensis]
MNNIEELREHCEEMIAISHMRYAYIPASSIITLIDRIEKAEKESKQWYSVVEAAISDDAEWRKQSNTASEAIGYLTTGIVMLKERAEKAEAALSAANEKLQVPAGYCIMPESLTAENGAKGALSGEFFTETHITCEECGGDCDEDDPCKHCNDLGVQTVRTAIGWSTIKDIYKMAVSATAIRQAGFTVEGNADAE